MERSFDDAAMLHFIRGSLFRSYSPLHHEVSVSLETFVAERIASRESECFPCISRDLHSCSQKLADTQAKVIELDQRIDALQATAASATAATYHRVDTLQSSTENATQAAANELRRVEHELSQCSALHNEFVRASTSEQLPVSTTTTIATSTTTVPFHSTAVCTAERFCSSSTTTTSTTTCLRTTSSTSVRSPACSYARDFGTPCRALE